MMHGGTCLILDDLSEIRDLTKGSHKIINVLCDYGISNKCRGQMQKQYRTILKDRDNNNGKDICMYCSRTIKNSGNGNPNKKYIFDDNYFEDINSEVKAYILGLIASDGHVGKGHIAISLHEKDKAILSRIKEEICSDLPLAHHKNTSQIVLNLCSTKMTQDVCFHLGIPPGKKSHTVKFPELLPYQLQMAFVRGFFDGDGFVAQPNTYTAYPKCSIATSSPDMREDIFNSVGIKGHIGKVSIEYSGSNALDFLHTIYEDSKIYMPRKRDLYLDWATWVPSLSGGGSYGREPLFKWNKGDKRAVPPFKTRASDSGYDLELLTLVETIGEIELWDTGIKVHPKYGWYFDLYPRSSIIKSGYILANSIGVIDRSYTGTIKVPLYKIDKSKPDAKMGDRLVQIIPKMIVHGNSEEVDEFEETERGGNGFGSSGR